MALKHAVIVNPSGIGQPWSPLRSFMRRSGLPIAREPHSIFRSLSQAMTKRHQGTDWREAVFLAIFRAACRTNLTGFIDKHIGIGGEDDTGASKPCSPE
jgi:hypothetical protein